MLRQLAPQRRQAMGRLVSGPHLGIDCDRVATHHSTSGRDPYRGVAEPTSAPELTVAMRSVAGIHRFEAPRVLWRLWGALGSVESAGWISCCCHWLIVGFEFDGCEHAKRQVAALAEDRVC